MNEAIRDKIRQTILEKYPSLRQFAIKLDMSPQYLDAVLSGGKVSTPPRFEDILDDLGLELIVREKL